MNDAKYINAINLGKRILSHYGNWDVPPWMINKYGFKKVESDLCGLFGHDYRLRKCIYTNDAGSVPRQVAYYIFEKKPVE